MANEQKYTHTPRLGVLDNTELLKLLQMNDDENQKSCWVCFGTEADDSLAAWVQPCKCSGTTKWPENTANSSNNEPVTMDIADESPIVVSQIEEEPEEINDVSQEINQSASYLSQSFDSNNPHLKLQISSPLNRFSTNNYDESGSNDGIQMAMVENPVSLLDDINELEVKKMTEKIIQQREKHILEMRKLELEIEILDIKQNNSSINQEF